jgi:DNA-binding GntR family transcriptional regulator
MSLQLGHIEVDRTRSMRDQLYRILRDCILTGQIKPGEIIDEKAIAAQIRVSRTPVREAVKRLSDEYLVEIIAQSATRAALLEMDHLREAFLIRRALECESAAQAALRWSKRHDMTLQAIVARQRRAIDAQRYPDAIALDDRFHRHIALISRLRRLWHTIEVSKAQLDRLRHIMLPKTGEGETTLQHHQCIILALRTQDPVAASDAMKSHLDIAFGSAVRMLSQSGLEFPIQPKPGGRQRL